MNQPANHPSVNSARAWLVCLTASLFFMDEFMRINMFNALRGDLMDAFHVSAAQYGQLSAYYFYGNVLMLFPAGMLLDRFSARSILLIVSVVCALASFYLGVTTHLSGAMAARFVVGLGGAFAVLSVLKLATRWFTSDQMALVLGVVVTLAMLGGFAAQTPYVLLKHHVGWRSTMLMDGCFGLITALVMACVVRDAPKGMKLAPPQPFSLATIWQSIKVVANNRHTWMGGLVISLLNLPVFIFGAIWGITYLTQFHHMTDIHASWITSMMFFGMIFGSPLLGWISDRYTITFQKYRLKFAGPGSRIQLLFWSTIISIACVLALELSGPLSFVTLMLLFFVVGFFSGAQVIGYPYVTEHNAPKYTGASGALASILIMSGGFIQPVFGWLLGYRGDYHYLKHAIVYTAADFKLALWLLPVAFVIAFCIILAMKETHGKPVACNGLD